MRSLKHLCFKDIVVYIKKGGFETKSPFESYRLRFLDKLRMTLNLPHSRNQMRVRRATVGARRRECTFSYTTKQATNVACITKFISRRAYFRLETLSL